MKFIIISYPPSFYTRIIPIGKVCEINTFVEQPTAHACSKCLKVNIYLENEIIFTDFINGEPSDFFEEWRNEDEIYLDCFEEENLSEKDKENIKFADALFKI